MWKRRVSLDLRVSNHHHFGGYFGMKVDDFHVFYNTISQKTNQYLRESRKILKILNTKKISDLMITKRLLITVYLYCLYQQF